MQDNSGDEEDDLEREMEKRRRRTLGKFERQAKDHALRANALGRDRFYRYVVESVRCGHRFLMK